MFALGPATKIYVAAEAVDMRKGSRDYRCLIFLDKTSCFLYVLITYSIKRNVWPAPSWKRGCGSAG